uniref:Uncharacterized protein n=1 Tax=Anguilla anguilla TaxID=7936 RepID=A0A0E9XQS0_ANGAN
MKMNANGLNKFTALSALK